MSSNDGKMRHSGANASAGGETLERACHWPGWASGHVRRRSGGQAGAGVRKLDWEKESVERGRQRDETHLRHRDAAG